MNQNKKSNSFVHKKDSEHSDDVWLFRVLFLKYRYSCKNREQIRQGGIFYGS